MKVAITAWNDRVSPLCDSARQLLLVDIEEGKIARRTNAVFPDAPPFHQAAVLKDLGVNLLICGAITMPLANLIESCGIQIMPFVTGKVNHVLEGFLVDRLSSDRFRMPGWHRKQKGRFQRRRRRGFM